MICVAATPLEELSRKRKSLKMLHNLEYFSGNEYFS